MVETTMSFVGLQKFTSWTSLSGRATQTDPMGTVWRLAGPKVCFPLFYLGIHMLNGLVCGKHNTSSSLHQGGGAAADLVSVFLSSSQILSFMPRTNSFNSPISA